MSTNDSAAAGVDDDYVVKLPSGDARVMSIDELDAALEAGTIHKDSPVLAPGTVTWTTLGVLAGLDDEPAAPAVPSPSSVAPMVMSATDVEVPLSLDSLDDDDSAVLRPRRRAGKVVVAAFGALAIFAVGFAIKSAISQTLATRAAEAALAAQPAASPLPAPPPPAPIPAPVVVEAAPPAPLPAAAPAPATTRATAASAKDKDNKKKNKLPGAPSAAPKKK
ncbi:MAG: hypothetical protein JWO86_2368 [Myxococcaceae bacterium]|nr:hypothetical protein [Myxococcaceae bacterium]